MKPLSILLADDHHATLAGLRAVLESQEGWQVCGEATTGTEAVEKAMRLKPNVVVMDFGLPGMNGVEATRRIRESLPGTEVVILTMHKMKTLTQEALAAGARGFVLKTERNGHLIAAVKEVAKHKMAYSTEALEAALPASQNGNKEDTDTEMPDPRLTERECEIIRLIAKGRTTKQVADTLRISIKTADVHRNNIMHKLHLHNAVELVRYAMRTGLAKLER